MPNGGPHSATKFGYKRYAMENTYKYENLLIEAHINPELSLSKQ